MYRVKWPLLLALFVVGATCVTPVVSAHAFNEVTNIDVWETDETRPVRTTCGSCHNPYGGGTPDTWGVHGGYDTTTDKCGQCHGVHATGSFKLLPGATVSAACGSCHDGTGGEGVYGAILARTLAQPGAAHEVEVTNSVPGGSATDGGSATMSFRGASGNLTCSDCHSIHGNNLVVAFKGDRRRTDWSVSGPYTSTKLLKKDPGGSATAVTEYGSDWCLACHAGRSGTLPTVHNHPVESVASAAPSAPYVYRNLPILSGAMPTSTTALGSLAVVSGGYNRGYLMPYPRTTGAGGQDGHGPICQQCHEDARNVGSLSDAGLATASLATVSLPVWAQPDGGNAGDNPRFTTFPHETVNAYFLVERDDDLCLNCHPAAQTP